MPDIQPAVEDILWATQREPRYYQHKPPNTSMQVVYTECHGHTMLNIDGV